MDYIIPEVFFWPADLDAETGDTVTHIVDGQQRITSIVEFISGDSKFPRLSTKYLLNQEIKEKCGDLSFAELPSAFKKKIWPYQMSIVNIDRSFTRDDIKQVFFRLNLTNYNLNPQEKRNSQDSQFGEVAEALSQMDFWKSCRVFSSADARRMKDVEYCCSIYILAIEGIVDQTSGKKINDYYEDYADSFDEDKVLTQNIESAMDFIMQLCDKTTLSFISKKAQMYTLFSIVFKLQEEGKVFTKEFFERFKLFVSAYNLFKNEYNISFNTEDLRQVNEGIKKYKLASSEGINKIGNRMIRFQTLYNFCVESPVTIKEHFSELIKLYEEQKGNKTKFEPLDKEDLIDTLENGLE